MSLHILYVKKPGTSIPPHDIYDWFNFAIFLDLHHNPQSMENTF